MTEKTNLENKVLTTNLDNVYDIRRTLDPVKIPIDWYRCLRFGPVSGRYEGDMTTPNAGKYALELRVDIDPCHSNAQVMDRVSGDIFHVYKYNWFGRSFSWRVYQESWIVDNPTVNWSKCSVEITGVVRFWKGAHIRTNVKIVIPWQGSAIGPAQVKFYTPYNSSDSDSNYTCTKKSNFFRSIKLEVDVCDSVNDAPILPSYDTDSHPDRPADLPQRVLTIEEAYKEAGFDVTINPSHSNIDDSASKFNTWSPAELHDAMETYFSQYGGSWPKWQMWCLLAGTYQSSSVGGIMFDAASTYGGAGVGPDRQGCAVFRNHSWFNNLVTNPTTDSQAEAMRKFLYTYVHEMGHAFNLLHSWDKSRPDALSWMNYDWKYDNRNGTDSFWNNFRMRFDDDELIHMRHGDRASVIMGGDPWASGGHLETPGGAMATVVGESPIELKIKSKGYYQFLEPVSIELRLRNATDLPLELDTQLNPEFGGVTIYIRRPNGKIVEYAPIMCKLATPELKVLKPLQNNAEGDDRHSQIVFLSYGSQGFYFNDPGEYLIRAVYQGAGNIMISSDLHRIRIGNPFSRDDEKIAQDFFSRDTGMALYLNGSSSPFLQKGMDVIEEMADRYKESPVGAHLSLLLAQNLSQPFYRLKDKKMVEARSAKPQEALQKTEQALKQQKKNDSTFQNITYSELRNTRADLLVATDNKPEAKKELKDLASDLEKRGVNKPVLEKIKARAKHL